MDSAKINDWVQVVGIFALVASLVFVGLQLKQSQDIALSQASQSRTDSTVEMIVSSAENSLFVSAVAKQQGRTGEAQTIEEQVAMGQYALALLFLYENQHFQYDNGFITEERWQAAKVAMAEFFSEESLLPLRSAYERNPALFSSKFQIVVDGLIAGNDNKDGSK